ncbi:hypothetical protein [Labilithrix luteola]|nr:hypothetical protein [Labilithrix luteola]
MKSLFAFVVLSLAGALGGCSSSDGGGSSEKPTSGAGTAGKVGCEGTAYTEALPTSDDLSSLTYSKTQAQQYMLDALAIRFPLGKYILEGGLSSTLPAQQGSCFDRFIDDTSSGPAVLKQASTIVHECGHFFDLDKGSGKTGAYVLRDDLEFACSDGDTTTRKGKTFARSLLRKDGYYASRPACVNKTAEGCDMYADTYLDGDPTDATFESGDQGFNSVLEEATQYVNSLASAYAFRDAYAGTRATERDGILTFLWYIERYLKIAHEQYPDAYEVLSSECWRQAILSVWDRGWFYLNASNDVSALGIDDAALETLVSDAALVAEIDALRSMECK